MAVLPWVTKAVLNKYSQGQKIALYGSGCVWLGLMKENDFTLCDELNVSHEAKVAVRFHPNSDNLLKKFSTSVYM